MGGGGGMDVSDGEAYTWIGGVGIGGGEVVGGVGVE